MPAYPKPPPFPGVKSLPQPIRGLTEFIFPQEGGGVEQIAPTPLMAAEPVLTKPAQALIDLLENFSHSTADTMGTALKKFGGERMHSILPKATKFNPPKGLELPKTFDPSPSGSIQGGGFGESPLNAYRRNQQGASAKMFRWERPSQSHGRGEGNLSPKLGRGFEATSVLPEIRQLDTAPAIKSLQDIDVTTPLSGPKKPYVKPPLSTKVNRGGNAARMRASNVMNPDKVRTIRKMVVEGATIEDLKVKYPEASLQTIKDIMQGTSWRSVE